FQGSGDCPWPGASRPSVAARLRTWDCWAPLDLTPPEPARTPVVLPEFQIFWRSGYRGTVRALGERPKRSPTPEASPGAIHLTGGTPRLDTRTQSPMHSAASPGRGGRPSAWQIRGNRAAGRPSAPRQLRPSRGVASRG